MCTVSSRRLYVSRKSAKGRFCFFEFVSVLAISCIIVLINRKHDGICYVLNLFFVVEFIVAVRLYAKGTQVVLYGFFISFVLMNSLLNRIPYISAPMPSVNDHARLITFCHQ